MVNKPSAIIGVLKKRKQSMKLIEETKIVHLYLAEEPGFSDGE